MVSCLKKGPFEMNIYRTCTFISAAVAIIAMICSVSCSTVPVTGRHELNLVSGGEETQLGLSSFDKLKEGTPINHDPAINAMVQRVGKRVAAVAGKDLPNAQWEFVVFESKDNGRTWHRGPDSGYPLRRISVVRGRFVGATPFDGVIVQPENEAESASAGFGSSSN